MFASSAFGSSIFCALDCFRRVASLPPFDEEDRRREYFRLSVFVIELQTLRMLLFLVSLHVWKNSKFNLVVVSVPTLHSVSVQIRGSKKQAFGVCGTVGSRAITILDDFCVFKNFSKNAKIAGTQRSNVGLA